jgi:Flp pilus assembly protein CpaB
MNTARIVVLIVALGGGAAYRASGCENGQASATAQLFNSVVGKTVTLELKPEQAETLARSRQTGQLTLALRSIVDVEVADTSDDEQPVKRGASANVVRYGVSSTSSQK